MRAVYINLKIGNMRKEQSFIIYPVLKTDTTFLIQSDKAIGRVDLDKKSIFLSKSRSNGYYGPDLCPSRGAAMVDLSESDMEIIKEGFNKMVGVTSTSGSSPTDRTVTLLG